MKPELKKLKNTINRFLQFSAMAVLIIFSASCSKDDEGVTPPEGIVHDPITLACDYFSEDRILTDDPDAPIDYIIPCEARVSGELTVEPGVVVAFEQDAGLHIDEQAKITMEGTAEKPIIFTGTQKTKGFWAGISTWSTNPSNIMKYVTIEYAGSRSIQYGETAGLCGFVGAVLKIDHCTFKHCKVLGLFWDASNNAVITNSTFTNNDLPMMVAEGWNRMEMFDGSNSYTGNAEDYVYIQYGGINADVTWKNIGVPYYVETRIYNRFNVQNDAILTIEPGTEIMFSSDTKLRIRDGASLIMVGTPQNKIILRGKNQVAGSWNSIEVSTNSVLNEIAYAEIKYAGQVTGYPNGAVRLSYSSYLNIHQVTFTNCFEYAMSFEFGGDHSPDFTVNYANLSLNNTPKMFSTWCGMEIPDPYTFVDCQ